MIIKNLLEVVPSTIVLKINEDGNATTSTVTAGNVLLNDKTLYNKKVKTVSPEGEFLRVVTVK